MQIKPCFQPRKSISLVITIFFIYSLSPVPWTGISKEKLSFISCNRVLFIILLNLTYCFTKCWSGQLRIVLQLLNFKLTLRSWHQSSILNLPFLKKIVGRRYQHWKDKWKGINWRRIVGSSKNIRSRIECKFKKQFFLIFISMYLSLFIPIYFYTILHI